MADDMWKAFGPGTKRCMQDGVHLLAVLWQSAWVAGEGDRIPAAKLSASLTPKRAMEICRKDTFLESMPISRIGKVLARP